MTPDTQQFVIRWGFIGLLAATLTSLIALGILAIVHDGALADTMVTLYQQIVQQGIYVVGVLLGLHTMVAPIVSAVQNKATAQAASQAAALAASQPASTGALPGA